jgi:signal transduction histidine kinase
LTQAKETVALAIARAQAELEEALSALEKIPAVDMSSVAFSAHALSNYLTVTEGTVELILLHLGDRADPQLRVWLEGVQHATNLMIRTVSQLMSASGTREAIMRFERADLPLLVHRLCNYYQRAAQAKTIRLAVAAAANVPSAWTDRVGAAAVLDNLLSNAVKYSASGKQIWVDVRGEMGWVVCSVRDEGPGLSQEDRAQLFQKGVRLTPKPTAGEVSTGFGLAVAKELIDKLGGQIGCESVLGQGSCFWFRLPAYQETPVVDPKSASPPAEAGETGRSENGPEQGKS